MPTLFLALPVPLDLAEELATETPEGIGIRAVPAINYHVTLAFLGNVPERQVSDIEDALSTIESPRFPLQFRGCGLFPGGSKPKVLYLSVAHQPALTRLHHQVQRLLAPFHFPKDAHPWVPHLTLARLAGASDETLAQFLSRHHPFETKPFRVTSMVLYESRPGPDHPHYIPRSECPLGDLRDYLLED